MTHARTTDDRDERMSVDIDPEVFLGGLLQVDPDEPADEDQDDAVKAE